MKKLILLLLFIPLVSFGQDLSDLKLENLKFGAKRAEGVFLHKEGIYRAVAVAGSGFTGINKMVNKTYKLMDDFARQNNYTYKFIKVDKEKGGPGKYTTAISWFYVYDSDGSLQSNKVKEEIINNKSSNDSKNNAIEELKKLKELLDLELITQEEFDIKSKELKKIILGN